MKQLYWQQFGTGKIDLVLLHGWGLNSEVWRCIINRLSPHFCLHLVDLPGFGHSASNFGELTLDEMANMLQREMPDHAILLGWSLGGLIASRIALCFPSQVRALITVASSPCFSMQEDWPGIKSQMLNRFQQQLSEDFQHTIERFLALQTLGTPYARQNTLLLKKVVLSRPTPSIVALKGGLEILKTADMRNQMRRLTVPLLRIYGYLDELVPQEVAKLLDIYWSNSASLVIPQAAHVPFISHPDVFCQQLIDFSLTQVR